MQPGTRRTSHCPPPVVALLVFCVVAPTVLAGALVQYSASTTTLAATSPPVRFGAGADSGNGAYVTGFSLGTNQTTFNANLAGLPGATVVITELVTVRNVDTVARSVTLRGDTVTNPRVQTLSIEVRNGPALIATLDLKAGSPAAVLGAMPAGATYSCLMKIRLSDGAGAHDTTVVPSIRLEHT